MSVTRLCVVFCLCAILSLSTAAKAPSGLYGLSPHVSLVRVDPSTAKMTAVGPAIPYEAQAQELSTVDSKNGILYFIGFNVSSVTTALVGLDLTTGEIVSEAQLPIVEGVFVGVGQVCDYDGVTGEVIVMGREQQTGVHHLMRVHPKTAKITEIAQVGDLDLLGGGSGFDPSADIEWISLAVNKSGRVEIDIFGYDVRSGKLVHQLDNTWNIDTFAYDAKSGLMICVGLDASSRTRTLLSLNSRSGTVTRLGTIPGFFIIDAAISALDHQNRVLYTLMEASGAPQGEMTLVGCDSDKGDVKTQPKMCSMKTGDCPWSLEWVD